MSGKVVLPVVSLILVVGVAIGTVMVVHKKSSDTKQLATHQNNAVVATICQNSDDKQFCLDTLSSVNNTSDPKAFIAKAVEATVNSVVRALNMTDRLSVDHGSNNNGVKMALDDCKDLLQFAMDSLQSSTDLLRNGSISTVHSQSPDFRNWLSAVISYQQACMDGFDENSDGEKQVKSQLQAHGLDDMQKLTAVALDIVADLGRILETFGLKLNLQPASRRLLDVDSEGYPTWFSASDRELMQLQTDEIKPNVVVAQDGSGQFKTINDAINSHPGTMSKGFQGRYVIFVKAGTYKEYIIVPKTAVNILMYGEGPAKTIVTGNKNFVDGTKTMQTATFANTANGFIAKHMTFENSAGAIKHQAVALRNQGDMSAFFDCAIVGNQDTLYVQTNRQFYRNCVISGTIDFIFGTSATIIQSSKIILRKPLDSQLNTVTADGTIQKNSNTGIVIQNCDFVAEEALMPVRFTLKSYLGRPWKTYSKTVIMESRISDVIQPEGWTPWAGDLYLNTLYYAEYNNEGPGANVQKRIKWPGYKGLISKNEAAQFTVGQFLKGGPTAKAEDWMNTLNVPFDIGFTKA